MPFYSSSFIYNGVASNMYNLYVSEIGGDGNSTWNGAGSMEIYNKKLYRRSTPFFYGSAVGDNMEFELSFTSPEDIDSRTSELIQKWLFSSRSYKKLMIVQPDMQDVYMNVILNDPQVVREGNLIRGYTCTAQCDSPFGGWKFPKTKTYTYTAEVIDTTVTFNNTSDDNGDYLYPQLVITMNNAGGDITITNQSDSNRVFSFTGLSPSETLTVDNSLQQISSSTDLKRMSNFNKKFFRLIPGINTIRFQGNVSSIAMTYQFVAKI